MLTIKSVPLQNYTRGIEKSVIIFGSPTCQACKKLITIIIPILEQTHPDITFMFLDGDKFVGTADYYDIEFYPTLIYYIYGVEQKRLVSSNIKEIEQNLLK